MNECYVKSSDNSIPIFMLTKKQYVKKVDALSASEQQWLSATDFKFKVGHFILMPSIEGQVGFVLCCIESIDDCATTSKLARELPSGIFHLEFEYTLSEQEGFNHALYWGLGCYHFSRYQSNPVKPNPSALLLNSQISIDLLNDVLESMYLGQDLVNTPTEDCKPQDLVETCHSLAEQFDAKITVIVGDDLIEQNFPLIHAVGRASDNPPCLIDLTWGNPQSPSITLVGKGVCYDTGGLSLKPTSNMKSMKKDMGGAASVIALARLIMAQQCDVSLRLLIPAVENSVAGNSYRPGDVFTSRSGLSIEITNTDAEGRLILADALAYAQETPETPNYLFDFATLTGAARVAMGEDVSPVFANQDQDAVDLAALSHQFGEQIWPMPLYRPYFSLLKSTIASMTNSASTGFGGAITASLFLAQFIQPKQRWWHFDVYCKASKNWLGLGLGARIPVLLTVFQFIQMEIKK